MGNDVRSDPRKKMFQRGVQQGATGYSQGDGHRHAGLFGSNEETRCEDGNQRQHRKAAQCGHIDHRSGYPMRGDGQGGGTGGAQCAQDKLVDGKDIAFRNFAGEFDERKRGRCCAEKR